MLLSELFVWNLIDILLLQSNTNFHLDAYFLGMLDIYIYSQLLFSFIVTFYNSNALLTEANYFLHLFAKKSLFRYIYENTGTLTFS